MANDKDPEIVLLVAIDRGFAMGRMVERGEKFQFRTADSNGKPRKLPKWAQPADKPLAPVKVDAAGDLKPKAAQKAVQAKAGQLTGSKPAEGQPDPASLA